MERLERQLGKDTITKREEDTYIDWQLDRAENEWNDYMAEQEQRLAEEFGGDYELMSEHDQARNRRRAEAMSFDPYAYG